MTPDASVAAAGVEARRPLQQAVRILSRTSFAAVAHQQPEEEYLFMSNSSIRAHVGSFGVGRHAVDRGLPAVRAGYLDDPGA